jgi:hypothetical protein
LLKGSSSLYIEVDSSNNDRITANGNSLVLERGTGSVTIDTSNVTSSKRLLVPASTTSAASFRVPHGTRPTSPVDGDWWTTTLGVYVRINGSDQGPLGVGAGGVSGDGTTGKVPKWSGTTSLIDSSISFGGTYGEIILGTSGSWADTLPTAGQTIVDDGHISVRAHGSQAELKLIDTGGSVFSIQRAESGGTAYVSNYGGTLVAETSSNHGISIATNSVERLAISGVGVITATQGGCPAQLYSGEIYTATATQTVTNTTTETTLISATGVGTLTLPANCLIPGRRLRVTIRGSWSDTGTPTLTIRGKLFGGTRATITRTMPASEGGHFSLVMEFVCRTDGSGVTAYSSEFVYSTAAGTTASAGPSGTFAANTTGSTTLDVTAEWSAASSSNTVTVVTANVELIG